MKAFILKFYISTMCLFSFFRLLHYIFYSRKVFADLSGYEVIWSFIYGLKFDASIIFTFYGLPTLCLLLPMQTQYVFSRALRSLGMITLIIVANVFLLLLIGDLIYFNQVHRHVADELLTIVGEWDFIRETLFSGYPLLFLLFFVGSGIAIFFIWRSYTRLTNEQTHGVTLVLFLLSAVLIIRGGFGVKPLNTVDAFRYGSLAAGQLTLNGPFSAWHTSRNRDVVEYPPLVEEDFREMLHKLELHSKAPFRKSYQSYFPGKKPNIVVILLESWASKYVDSFGGEKFSVTPHFDSLAQESMKFNRFYASGARSIEALQAVLTSFPSLKGLPTLGLGFELKTTASLGHLAQEAGYESYFFQSAKRQSFRLDAIAAVYGFQHYFGMEDYPILRYPDHNVPVFGWDYEMFMVAVDKMSDGKKPFFSFLFTGTTHTPFVKMDEFLHADKHGPENEWGFLNSLNYADWALGEFFKEARKQPWFEDTIFILTADHTLQSFREFSFEESFAVPLLIYSPKYFKPAVANEVAGHLDILPTILHIMGTERSVPTVGRSLLSSWHYHYALVSQRYSHTAWIDKSGVVVADVARLAENNSSHKECRDNCLSEQERYLRAMNSYLFEALRHNSF